MPSHSSAVANNAELLSQFMLISVQSLIPSSLASGWITPVCLGLLTVVIVRGWRDGSVSKVLATHV